jgi:1,4-dihydroxy-2-naphthoyl-CoA hydrolase
VGSPPITLADALDPRAWSAFLRASGLTLEEATATQVTATLDLGPDHHQPWGIVHGGVYTTAAETAASLGAAVAAPERGLNAVGVNNSTDFLRPLRAGRVAVRAEALQQGRTQQLWAVAMTREDGKPVALSRVRLQNVSPDGLPA